MKAASSGSPLCTAGVAVSRRALLLGATASAATTGYDRIEIDPASGIVTVAEWPDSERAVLPGSLVKPFTAIAYERSNHAFPSVTCKGCWGGKAHGTLNLPRAIAVSCNRYFEELSLRVDHHQMRLVCGEYGLPDAPDLVDARLGLGRAWRITPAAILRAYLQVSTHPAIREGMRICAAQGTAKALGKGIAKTGTSPCEHVKRMPGDGLAIWLWPETGPRRAVLVREHGVPGSAASRRIRT